MVLYPTLTVFERLETLEAAFTNSTVNINYIWLEDIFYNWTTILGLATKAFINYMCNKNAEIATVSLQFKGEQTKRHLVTSIHRVEFEDILIQLDQLINSNKAIPNTLSSGNYKITPQDFFIILVVICNEYFRSGEYLDTYDIDVDIVGVAKFVSPTANIPAEKLTTTKTTKTTKKPKINVTSILSKIGNKANNYAYRRHTFSTAREMRKHGYGDCWAMAAYLCQELKKEGINARRRGGSTKYSPVHRWAEYYNNGKWHPFPYSKYGIDSMFGYTTHVSNVYTLKGCGE